MSIFDGSTDVWRVGPMLLACIPYGALAPRLILDRGASSSLGIDYGSSEHSLRNVSEGLAGIQVTA